MSCYRCNSPRICSVQSHASDCHSVRIGDKEGRGYLPDDLGIGGGDDLEMSFCLDCGQIQGKFPLPPTELENKEIVSTYMYMHPNGFLYLSDRCSWVGMFDAKVWTKEEKEEVDTSRLIGEWVEA